MPTRRQDAESREFQQGAFASSAEYERGLLGNLVAARCHSLTDREEITLLWWLQQVSWRDGGMEAFAKQFLEENRAEIGTPSMFKFGVKPGQIYSRSQVQAVRDEMSGEDAYQFPLRGDRTRYHSELELAFRDCPDRISVEDAAKFPDEYPAERMHAECMPSEGRVAEILKRTLVDPETRVGAERPVYFPAFWDALHAWRQREIETARGRIVETAVTRQIGEELDFALETRSFILIEGREGIGKSDGARSWCDQHPGQAIYVRLEAGSDETTLYRSIARRVGTACSYQRKAVEMRARIQDALQSGHIMLVLDEAHFLWPQGGRSERGVPKRMDWLRTALVDFNVPVALVSTPQYFTRQCDRFRKAGWNANQVQRRLARTVLLPETLAVEDLLAVARSYFPGSPIRLLKRCAAVALLSVARLTIFSHMRKRVDFLASRRAGMNEPELLEAALAEIAAPGGAGEGKPAEAVAVPLQGPRRGVADAISQGEHGPRNRLNEATRELAPSAI